ncbi:MAG: response regulator [Gemmatimonadota bacterium]|nr:response regulator [Gemmatimonadota bacterium]
MPATRLLIAEDSELVASALRLLFEEAGYDVRVAGSVSDVIRVGTEWKPEVMLLDLTLADGDGLDALDRLSADGVPPRATIALTGHDDHDVRERCLQAGCHDVLIKPVPIARLRELVRSL